MAGNAFHLFVTIVAFSFLIFFIDPPTTRARHLVREGQAIPSPDDIFQINEAEIHGETMEMPENDFFHSRIDFEINRDYPGSGANNRHTPNPPLKD